MSEKRKIIGVTVGTPLSPSKIREKFSPFIRQQNKTDEINRPIYNLKIGKEYKAEAEQTLTHSLAVGLLGDTGIEWRYIFSEESAKDFTIKVIGAEDTTIFYEYCGELRSYDYSPYLTSAHTLEGVQLVWGGDLYLCNPDAIKDGKSAYEIAVEYGYEGTEEEWANGLNPNKIVENVLNTMEQAEDWVL